MGELFFVSVVFDVRLKSTWLSKGVVV